MNPHPQPGTVPVRRQTDLICTPQRRAAMMPQATQAARALRHAEALLAERDGVGQQPRHVPIQAYRLPCRLAGRRSGPVEPARGWPLSGS